MQLANIELHQDEEPFESLNTMRDEHLRLLEAQGEEPETVQSRAGSIADEIETFLRRGVALGRFIEPPELRSEAQGMLDYWVSTLSIFQRDSRGEKQRALVSAILERFDSSVLDDAINEASNLFASLSPAERETARKMLMRLAPMSQHSNSFELKTLPTQDLTSGRERALQLLEKFEKAGVIQKIENSDSSGVNWRLAHESMIHRWPEFAEWTAERRRFRQAAELWEEATRSASRLNTRKESLDDALAYRDLNILESDFLEASSSVANKLEKDRQKLRMIGISIAVAIATIMGFFTWNFVKSSTEKKMLKKDLGEKKEEVAKIEGELSGEKLAAANNITPEYLKLRNERDDLRQELASLKRDLTQIDSAIKNKPDGATFWEARLKLNQIVNDGISADPMESQSNYNDSIAQALAPDIHLNPEFSIALSPGLQVGAEGKGKTSYGSAGIFLTDEKGSIYLAAPAYVIGSRKGQEVEMKGQTIGRVERTFGKDNDPLAISIARLKPGIKADNILPSVGAINGWAKDPVAGTEVILIGQGSGIRSGEVLRVEKDGTIVTTRISQPGDGGAPVINKSRQLLGFLLESRAEESIISPCGPLLEKTGLKLLVNATGSTNLDGALAQIIVPDSDPRYLAAGNRILEALRKKGIFTPDGTALAKSSNPAQVDVRYYHLEDEELAKDFKTRLEKMGLKEIKIWHVVDPDPPAKFIQIALNEEELNRIINP